MRDFARGQTEALLRHFGTQMHRTARSPDPDAIHDLRVSIRRLNRCLRVFAEFYPGDGWRKIRRRLKGLMEFCGAVRDRDIARELLSNAGFAEDSIVMLRLNLERAEALQKLTAELQRWTLHGVAQGWRVQLGL
ncbi:MAG TPA: CHAD domain-containing protein [Verrucomicrobiae bacterium]|nr:CHAD domain-containing protein [Verrucomicrobiae bacterium]